MHVAITMTAAVIRGVQTLGAAAREVVESVVEVVLVGAVMPGVAVSVTAGIVMAGPPWWWRCQR